MPNSPTREPRLFSISTFSWLLVGRDSLRRTLVTSMIVMGNLSENRLVLAVGIIEHAALFAPCIANNQSFFKICQVFTYWSLLLKCDLSSWCLSYLKTKNVSLQDNMSSNKYEYICPTGLLIPNTNPVNQADDCTACTQHLPNYPCARQLMPFKALYYGWPLNFSTIKLFIDEPQVYVQRTKGSAISCAVGKCWNEAFEQSFGHTAHSLII